MKLKSVKILSRWEALDLAVKGDSRVHLVSIRNSTDPRAMYASMDSDPEKWAGLCKLSMDDIEHDEPPYVLPELTHVSRAIEFSKTCEHLVVHCTAGICRSSAIAYLCACQRMDYEEAAKFVEPKQHWPNSHIVRLGAEHYKDPRIYDVLQAHMQADFSGRHWPRVASSGYGS